MHWQSDQRTDCVILFTLIRWAGTGMPPGIKRLWSRDAPDRNSRWGIKYLYQPFITAQLGVFWTIGYYWHLWWFYKSHSTSFRYIDILFNAGNQPQSSTVIKRSNFILPLNKPYEALANQYNEKPEKEYQKISTGRFDFANWYRCGWGDSFSCGTNAGAWSWIGRQYQPVPKLSIVLKEKDGPDLWHFLQGDNWELLLHSSITPTTLLYTGGQSSIRKEIGAPMP